MATFFAVATPGLEPACARELSLLGLDGSIVAGGVRFDADLANAPRLVRSLRTPARLLVEVAAGPARSLDALSQLVAGVDWRPLMAPGVRADVAVSSKRSRLRFKERVAGKVEQVLRREVGRAARGRDVQRVQVRILDDVATISVDAGGELLHRRGWRLATAKAPLRENLAATLLVMAGWEGDEALVDPCCGAGTIPIEAARMARALPAGVDRRYACDAWPAAGRYRPPPPRPLQVPIVGVDRDPGAIRAATDNAERAGVDVDWRRLDLRELEPPAPTGLVVANPPYGVRVGAGAHKRGAHPAGGFYAALGRTLRERFRGWRALFLAPEPALAHKVHRDAACLTRFKNGGISVGVWVIELS